jgi:tRNA uridine 5-carboxymethylaminomethyl modification enzyme
MKIQYDIIIVGAGHAGIEAASIASKFNLNIAVLTLRGVDIGSTPCNPSIGGVGKGQVVREIDALGGIMGKLADLSCIQARTLNTSKGYAVQSTRFQIDKVLYSKNATQILKDNSKIDIIYGKLLNVSKEDDLFILDYMLKNKVLNIKTNKLIMTTGTFLNSKLHIGDTINLGGRHNCDSSDSLENIFKNIKTLNKQFKTGTPPRLNKASIDFSLLIEQKSDPKTNNFHHGHSSNKRFVKQHSCYIGHTNNDTIDVIKSNLHKSPMYNGQITGIGPRYCPSIEDKVSRFESQKNHHVFIEPESESLDTYYPNGISTSLPLEVQKEMVNSIKGLENATIDIPGYAVEYDVVDTVELNNTLEYCTIPGLYFAGQVNGTSGYEEAAGQGIIAGINASFSLMGREAFVIDRYDSYIGVMIDDLVNNFRDEPYRLFTARSDNRLLIREDNTVPRLRKYRELMNIDDYTDQYQKNYLISYELLKTICLSKYIGGNNFLKYINITNCGFNNKKISCLVDIIVNPELNCIEFLENFLASMGLYFSYEVISNVAIDFKYEGYISRMREHVCKVTKFEHKKINYLNYVCNSNISIECRGRIKKVRPENIGQLKRIDGIRPATVGFIVGSL